MQNQHIAAVEAANMKKDLPEFEIGDTVSVGVRIIEGTKERTSAVLSGLSSPGGARGWTRPSRFAELSTMKGSSESSRSTPRAS